MLTPKNEQEQNKEKTKIIQLSYIIELIITTIINPSVLLTERLLHADSHGFLAVCLRLITSSAAPYISERKLDKCLSMAVSGAARSTTGYASAANL